MAAAVSADDGAAAARESEDRDDAIEETGESVRVEDVEKDRSGAGELVSPGVEGVSGSISMTRYAWKR